MDMITITAIASETVTLMVPFLKKAGEKISEKVGESAWQKAKQVYETVKSRFSSKPSTVEVMNALEKSPEDTDTQAAMRFHLKEMMSADEGWAKELSTLLHEASNAGAENVFGIKISGDVYGSEIIGVNKGNLTINRK